jgi:hypothetical protein
VTSLHATRLLLTKIIKFSRRSEEAREGQGEDGEDDHEAGGHEFFGFEETPAEGDPALEVSSNPRVIRGFSPISLLEYRA